MRFHLLNADLSQVIVLGIWYAIPNRLEVYTNGGSDYVPPLNIAIDPVTQKEILSKPLFPNEYIPNVATASAGDNYFDRDSSMLYIAIRFVYVNFQSYN